MDAGRARTGRGCSKRHRQVALDVMGHTSIAYASHLHDSVYTRITRAHANNGCCTVAMRMRMRCIAVQYDASFPSPEQRNPQPGPSRVPRADSCNRIFDDPQWSDAITARCIRAPFTHERFSPETGDKTGAQLKLSSNRGMLLHLFAHNEDTYSRKYLIS